MSIIGTNFTKINVEKKEHTGKVSIKNNTVIKDLKPLSLNIGKSTSNGVKFVFKHTTNYEPNIASMVFEGEVLFLADQKATDELLDNWKNKKPIDEKVMVAVMNASMRKATIKALDLSQDFNLPSPVKLPKVTHTKPKK